MSKLNSDLRFIEKNEHEVTIPMVKNSSVLSNSNKTDHSDSSSSNAPPNAPEGGVWGSIKYNGEKSWKRNQVGCAFLVIPGLVMLGCPRDKKDAYAVWEEGEDGRDIYIYDSSGTLLGPRKKFIWSPNE